MLCLKRARGEAVQLFLDGRLVATVGIQSISPNGVRLGIQADPEYVILRAEIPLKRTRKRRPACGQPSESPSSAGSAADCS